MREGAIAVSGMRTSIVRALRPLLPVGEEVVDFWDVAFHDMPDRILFCHGLIYHKRITEQLPSEIYASLLENMVSTVKFCERLLEARPEVRICVVGSQSATNGSFDQTYALAKAGLQAFVKWRTTSMNQQLVAVSPPLIADSYWATQRHDYPRCLEEKAHCTAKDVAGTIVAALYSPQITLTNVVLGVPYVEGWPHTEGGR